MEFKIDQPPPAESEIISEREQITETIKRIRTRDLVLTSIIVLVTSVIIACAVYWLTDSYKYAAISAIIYPVLSVVLNLFGITVNAGFRSAAQQMIELNNNLIALKSISRDNADVKELTSKYNEIAIYADKVHKTGRDFVNGELAMFWAWDASTQAKTAKARNFVSKAKKDTGSDYRAGDAIEGFVLDGGEEKAD